MENLNLWFWIPIHVYKNCEYPTGKSDYFFLKYLSLSAGTKSKKKKKKNRLENESAHSVSFKYRTVLSYHIRIYHTYMNSIYMSREYVYEKRIFPIVLKEIQGGARSAPSCILYTLYMYCRMTVMQSRIDRFFFYSDVFGFGIFV